MRTVVIGYTGHPADERYLADIAAIYGGTLGEIEHFDMERHPENGDAVEALECVLIPDLVIALNIYGLRTGAYLCEAGPNYNRRNAELFALCQSRGIRLAVCGDPSYGEKRWMFFEALASAS